MQPILLNEELSAHARDFIAVGQAIELVNKFNQHHFHAFNRGFWERVGESVDLDPNKVYGVNYDPTTGEAVVEEVEVPGLPEVPEAPEVPEEAT